MNSKGMVFFYDWLLLFEELTNEEIGQMIMAAAEYSISGTVPDFDDRTMKVVFRSIARSIDLSNEKKDDIGAIRSEAARKRWDSAKACKPMQADANDAIQDKTRQYNTIHDMTKQDHDNTRHDKDKTIQDMTGSIPPQSPPKGGATLPRSECFAQIENRKFPADVENQVKTWIDYKLERKEGYKPLGFRSLLSQIGTKVADLGEDAVIDVIQLSMSNGWKGIIWDRARSGTSHQGTVIQEAPVNTAYREMWRQA